MFPFLFNITDIASDLLCKHIMLISQVHSGVNETNLCSNIKVNKIMPSDSQKSPSVVIFIHR